MLHRLTSPLREFGLVAGLLYATDRLLSSLSPAFRLYFYELMAQPIPDRPLLPARFAKQLEIREVKQGDPEVDLMPARRDIKESRFKQNAICLGAFQKGQFIGYIWFCFHTYEEDEVRCTYVLPAGNQAVFDFDLYVFPEYRMGVGFTGIWNGANEFLRRRGIKVSFSRLTKFNVASRRAHDHLGWKRVGQAVFLQAWRLELMLAAISPYVHLSWTSSRRVRLQLRPDPLLLPEAASPE
jgi:hypothetical protein